MRLSLNEQDPYNLILLDIMRPNVDGHAALAAIRSLESGLGVAPADEAKVIMTTALSDASNVMKAFKGQCDGSLVKPIRKEPLFAELEKLGFQPV